jgi:PIN domain nuclease of toxin-antitoxin system
VKLLLDTHALIWALVGSPRISSRVRALLEDRENDLFVSAVSIFEIINKVRLGKLPEAAPMIPRLDDLVRQLGASTVPVTGAHARLAAGIQSQHRDPFDRLIAAQALVDGLALVSVDRNFPTLGVQPIW